MWASLQLPARLWLLCNSGLWVSAALLSRASDVHGIRPYLAVRICSHACHSPSEFVYANAGYEWWWQYYINQAGCFCHAWQEANSQTLMQKREMLGVWGSCSWRTQFLKLQGLIQYHQDSFYVTLLLPFTLYPLVSTDLFSISARLLLFCIYIHLHEFSDSIYNWYPTVFVFF